MTKPEAKSAAKALDLQAAALAGLEVGPYSPERFVELMDKAFDRVETSRQPTAAANLLRVIAATLDVAQEGDDRTLGEGHVDAGRKKVCPVYPFGHGPDE